jgi:hypothetical protein
MTMGLPCDDDGYDLRTPQCAGCGSRGCHSKCWQEQLRRLINFADDHRYSSEAIGICFRNSIEILRAALPRTSTNQGGGK